MLDYNEYFSKTFCTMMPYVYIYSFLFVLVVLMLVLKRDTQRLYIFYAAVFILALFVSFRDVSVGTDTQTYVNFFHNSEFKYAGERTDFLFEQLGRFLHLFGSSSEYFIFTTGLLSLFGVIILC